VFARYCPCANCEEFWYFIVICGIYCVCDWQMGYTALHRATAQGHLEVVRALAVAGSLVDCHDFMVRLM